MRHFPKASDITAANFNKSHCGSPKCMKRITSISALHVAAGLRRNSHLKLFQRCGVGCTVHSLGAFNH